MNECHNCTKQLSSVMRYIKTQGLERKNMRGEENKRGVHRQAKHNTTSAAAPEYNVDQTPALMEVIKLSLGKPGVRQAFSHANTIRNIAKYGRSSALNKEPAFRKVLALALMTDFN